VAPSAAGIWAATGPAPWLLPALAGIAAVVVVFPFDADLSRAATRLAAQPWFSGDVRRELTAWQQYGQGTALLVAALFIWLLDPPRRRRLLDLGLAAGLAQLVSSVGKTLVGRPRPVFGDPRTILGPWGEYPVRGADGGWRLVHAWERSAADLWSMPSSHTLFAVVLSVFLGTLYPRARPLVWALAAVVGVARVLLGAHWPTDVLAGAAAGWLIGRAVVPRYAGVRLVDWVWVRAVDRRAVPAFPALAAADRARARTSSAAPTHV
jgi:membrane-associated phospholipid phosphatase